MIDAIELENFQSHQQTILEFDPGVNVIKGRSHSGKSSIIRGLEWLFFNRPRGEGFKSHFASKDDPVSVGATFMSGQWIVRTKDYTTNGYLSEHHTLKAFKTDVPKEITDISIIGPINLQKQGDPYFLIGETPGQAGKKLNEFVGLEIIDDVRSKVTQKINKNNVKLKITVEGIDKTSDDLLKFDHLVPAELLVVQIEKHKRSYDQRFVEAEILEDIYNKLIQSQNDIQTIKNKLKIEPQYHHIVAQIEKNKQLKSKYEVVEDTISSIYLINESAQRARIALSMEKELESIKSDQKQAAEMRLKRFNLSEAYSGIRFAQKFISTQASKLKIDLKRHSELQKQLEKELDYCPKCGSLRTHWRKDYART